MKPRISNSSPLSELWLNQVPYLLLSGRIAFFLFLFDFFVGITGFMWLEGYTLLEAVFMVVITVSTVGYTEVRPLSDQGYLFVSLYIMFNVAIFAYLLAVFSYYIINGELFKKLHLRMIRKQIEKLNDHVIICGYGRYGKELVQHFSLHKIPFVVIEMDAAVVNAIAQSNDHILYVHGDATIDEVLQKAKIQHAKALIAALPDDSENLFLVLTARELNKKLKIISRSSSHRPVKKLRLAGADHVIIPEQIGGFYMAALVSKPGATEFFSRITQENETDVVFEEINFDNVPEHCHNMSISDLNIRRQTGASVIGYIDPSGNFFVNPNPDTRLQQGSSFIVLGSGEQVSNLRKYMQSLGG